MKKIVAMIIALVMLTAVLTGCGAAKNSYSVGVCQLAVHPSLDLFPHLHHGRVWIQHGSPVPSGVRTLCLGWFWLFSGSTSA